MAPRSAQNGTAGPSRVADMRVKWMLRWVLDGRFHEAALRNKRGVESPQWGGPCLSDGVRRSGPAISRRLNSLGAENVIDYCACGHPACPESGQHGTMTMTLIETDYLVIGAGASGMAFVDTLLTETDADIVIVDRRSSPGGHWNDAYPFVRLHQPSAYYGVASRPLGTQRVDTQGCNAGFCELASGPEVVAHYENLMRERFLPSGRVRFLPMTEYLGDGRLRGLLSDETHAVRPRKRIVDATFLDTRVPATHQRRFRVADGVACIPPNDLPRRAAEHRDFVILGAGKTAMDAAVWLLEHGADPDRITWVRPRESWLINRRTTQPGVDFFHDSVGNYASQVEAMAAASTCTDLFDRFEACGFLLRIDRSLQPEMFHFAVISEGEIALLRTIERVISGHRIAAVEEGSLHAADGTQLSVPAGALHVDCTACAVTIHAPRPVFADGRITLQMLRVPLIPFSAALIAHLESLPIDDVMRNRLSRPGPFPDRPDQLMLTLLHNMMSQYAWLQDAGLRTWTSGCRLEGFGAAARDADPADPAVESVLSRIKVATGPAVANLQRLIAETPGAEKAYVASL